jgi:cell division protein ZapA
MAVQTLKIELLGTSFTIQTDESREYMDEILAHIKKRTEDVQRATRVGDPLKASLLTNVYLVDELFRERARLSTRDTARELGRWPINLIDRLDGAGFHADERADVSTDGAVLPLDRSANFG